MSQRDYNRTQDNALKHATSAELKGQHEPVAIKAFIVGAMVFMCGMLALYLATR